MAEAMSQTQIDDLLNRMRAGEVSEKVDDPASKIKEYDFSLPKKFTKDQLKSLRNLNENFSRVLSSYFTSILRDVCEVSISQIEEQRYFEFNNSLPDNTLVGIVGYVPTDPVYTETTVMIEFSSAFGFLLIDRLLGGSTELFVPERDYSEVEISVLTHVLENVTKFMQESWHNYFELTTSLRSVETNGRMLQTFSQQDIVVIVTFEIKVDDVTTNANICMPANDMEDIINSFSLKYAHAIKQQDAERERLKQEIVLDYLKQSDLVVEAFLDSCNMSLADITHLQVNDVISLNKKIDDNIEVVVEGIPWYTARLGEVNSQKALKLVESINKNGGKFSG